MQSTTHLPCVMQKGEIHLMKYRKKPFMQLAEKILFSSAKFYYTSLDEFETLSISAYFCCVLWPLVKNTQRRLTLLVIAL